MSVFKNEIHIRGRLGADPEFFTAQSGKQFYRINVAVNEDFNDKSKVSWFPVMLSGKVDASAWKKGDLVDIEGRASNRSYQTKEGQKRYSLTIFANSVFNISLSERTREKKNAEVAEEMEFDPTKFEDLPEEALEEVVEEPAEKIATKKGKTKAKEETIEEIIFNEMPR